MRMKRWKDEEIKLFTDKLIIALKKVHDEKGRNFTFTTPYLAEIADCNGYVLRHFIPYLIKKGVIEKTNWKSRKRILYRTTFDSKRSLADFIENCEKLKQTIEFNSYFIKQKKPTCPQLGKGGTCTEKIREKYSCPFNMY
jgi:hypothetical protein